NDGGIHQSALGHHDACFGQPAIDGLEQLTGQLMLLEQVAEIHPRFYVSTSKSIIKALINMHSFEIQLSPIG
ncbi:hypothetical protein CIG30_28795, partial [Klebsiella pneumoniae]